MAKAPKPVAAIENGNVYILQAGTKVFVKTADICSIVGVTNQWIGQKTAQGVINKTSTSHGGMYNLIDTLKAYCEYTLKKAKKTNGTDEESDAEMAKLVRDKFKAETTIKTSCAIKESLEVKELQGKMHRSEDVCAMTEDLIYTIRSALLAMPGRLAIQLDGCANTAERSAIIQREVYKIMRELANYTYDSRKYEERVRARQGKEKTTEEDAISAETRK